jgi:hypothetical protein
VDNIVVVVVVVVVLLLTLPRALRSVIYDFLPFVRIL